MTYLFELVHRVPDISEAEIAEMRHIEPILQEGLMFRRIRGANLLHPREVSCIWDAQPEGDLFTFGTLDVTTIITQHHSSVFFKPSLAEVYAWIRVYMPRTWREVKFFCLGETRRIGSSTDIACNCLIMGGEVLVRGKPILFADNSLGYQLIKKGKE